MKDHGLIMSSPMILATLAGRKTQTRRIPGPTNSLVDGKRVSPTKWKALKLNCDQAVIVNTTSGDEHHSHMGVFSKQQGGFVDIEPIYKRGDLLYFRENWFPSAINGNRVLITYDKDKPEDCLEITVEDTGPYWKKMERGCIIPSIHLPKEASRIWAECTGVCCQHLQDITEEEAKREGVDRYVDIRFKRTSPFYKNYSHGCGTYELDTALESFYTLWGSINGWDSWTANPQVYAISYKILSTTGRPLEEDPDRDKTYQEEKRWL